MRLRYVCICPPVSAYVCPCIYMSLRRSLCLCGIRLPTAWKNGSRFSKKCMEHKLLMVFNGLHLFNSTFCIALPKMRPLFSLSKSGRIISSSNCV